VKNKGNMPVGRKHENKKPKLEIKRKRRRVSERIGE
jgi:hypothetical protein